MEKRMTKSPGLEDIPYLFHHIMSLLPVKEAACTSILSKSWLHAWSTIPKLRFNQSIMRLKQFDHYINLIDHTLLRYFEHNIPVESFHLKITVIKDQKLASQFEKMLEQWIRGLAPKRCFNELCIIYADECFWTIKFTLPDEIFSGVNLTSLSVVVEHRYKKIVEMCHNPVINCVSLRVLELIHVHTSEEVLNKLLSTCTLLEKINVYLNNNLKTLKVKNLHFLRELSIRTYEKKVIVEVDDVPSLCLFNYCTFEHWSNPLPFNLTPLGGVKELWLGGMAMYDTFFDMIDSSFPYLESLSLRTWFMGKERWNIRCVSLKKLTLILWQNSEIDLQIFAPKLLCFEYKDSIIRKLSFPTNVPKQVNLILWLWSPVDHLFFLKMREALRLSSNFDIDISYCSSGIVGPLNMNIEYLRRKVRYPATNVRQLLLKIDFEERMGEYLQFIDIFFLVCHPEYVTVYRDKPSKNINSYKQMVKWMIEKKMPEVIDVKIKDPDTGKWEDQTNVWRSSPENLVALAWYELSFQLNWCPN